MTLKRTSVPRLPKNLINGQHVCLKVFGQQRGRAVGAEIRMAMMRCMPLRVFASFNGTALRDTERLAEQLNKAK